MNMKTAIKLAEDAFRSSGGEYQQGPFALRAEWAASVALADLDYKSLLLLVMDSPKLLKVDVDDLREIGDYDGLTIQESMRLAAVHHIATAVYKKFERTQKTPAQPPSVPELPVSVAASIEGDTVTVLFWFLSSPPERVKFNFATDEDGQTFAAWLTNLRNPRWVRETIGVS